MMNAANDYMLLLIWKKMTLASHLALFTILRPSWLHVFFPDARAS